MRCTVISENNTLVGGHIGYAVLGVGRTEPVRFMQDDVTSLILRHYIRRARKPRWPDPKFHASKDTFTAGHLRHERSLEQAPAPAAFDQSPSKRDPCYAHIGALCHGCSGLELCSANACTVMAYREACIAACDVRSLH
jgi:hypothetical protein